MHENPAFLFVKEWPVCYKLLIIP